MKRRCRLFDRCCGKLTCMLLDGVSELGEQPLPKDFGLVWLVNPARAIEHRQGHHQRMMMPGAVLPRCNLTIGLIYQRHTFLRAGGVSKHQAARLHQRVRFRLAVIGGQSCRDDRAHAQHAIHCPQTLDDFAKTDQRDMRWIDDAEDLFDALLTEIGNRDRRFRKPRTARTSGARTLHDITKIFHQGSEALLVCIEQGWHLQKPILTTVYRAPVPRQILRASHD